MSDPYLTSYGVVVAALRDDPEAIRALFAGLTPAEIAATAEGAVLAMAGTLREHLDPHTIQSMIRAVQQLAQHDAAEGKTR
ncbi:hypothetical protein HY68_12735 [Streptomyces sp. AcH 505]|uniref:hypothetical protein n=1 Tax=Streptomyces sp. AcH 505 TaxID=352211 RepID=UPI00059219C0|nr:hypothetical protein HY68_12735 [Streptomyces sp. AcH 505]